MSFIIIVPTYYVIYKIADLSNVTYEFIKECKTKGAALKWIDKSGEGGVNYFIQETFRTK